MGALTDRDVYVTVEGDAEITGVARATMPRHVQELHAQVCLIVQHGSYILRVPLTFWDAQNLIGKIYDIITEPVTPLPPRKVASE